MSVRPIRLLRLANFARDVANGLPIDPSSVDAELNQLISVVTGLTDLIEGVTTADGLLQFTQALREMQLIETLTFTGVAGSSQIVTVPSYNPATDKAEVFVNGLRLDPSAVGYTDSTHITITHAFVGGEDGVIDLSSNGTGALTSLASTAVNLGASLVGIYDAGGLYTSTTVESALQEVMGDLNALITAIGTIANYIKKDGSVAFTGDQSMGGHKLTNLANATNPQDAVAFAQLTAYTDIWDDLAANFLPLGGGTMSGAVNMGNNAITQLLDPADAQDAATKAYVDAQTVSASSPIGTVVMFVGSAVPNPAWVLCDGSAIGRTAYAALNTILSTGGYKYGAGDGSTTFNVPDFRGRVPLGVGSGAGLTPRNLGDTGGEEAHTMTIEELVIHHHEVKDAPSHFGGGSLDGYSNDGSFDGTVTGPATDGMNTAATTPFNVMAPWLGITFMIRVQ